MLPRMKALYFGLWMMTLASCKGSGESPADRIKGALFSASKPMPETLSETNLFVNPSYLSPQEGVLRYEVSVPLWSDGARKERFIFLPPDKKLRWDPENQRFTVPLGTVFIKHFASDTGSTSFIETRVMVLKDDGKWNYATYIWQEDGSTAKSDDMTKVNGVNTTHQDYRVPSNDECHFCHGEQGVLGFQPRQLNKWQGKENQLAALQTARGFDLFADDPSTLQAIKALPPASDRFASIEKRARAYLDVNCSSCHHPEGIGSLLDLRLTTPLKDTHLLESEAVIAGDHEKSLLWQKMNEARAEMRMPPTALHPDPQGLALIRQWIDEMKP